jgi:hypothetical protein
MGLVKRDNPMQSISVIIVVICLLTIILCVFVYKIKGNSLETIQKSASQGNARDQYNLGLMYMHGNGIEQDDTLAIHWFQKAAEQGCQKALNNLSIIHERGIVRLDKYKDAGFHSYYETHVINDTDFILRVAVPSHWKQDHTHTEDEEYPPTLISPDGVDITQAELFLAISMNEITKNHYDNINSILQSLESKPLFGEDRFTKDQRLSQLVTYEKRAISVWSLYDENGKYMRKVAFIPLKESPKTIIILTFQINYYLPKEGESFYFQIFEDIIRSLKCQEATLDQKEKEGYITHLVTSKELIKYIGKQ